MGKHETKAMFFDVDGTLVSFKTHRIPQSTVDALTEAHSRGVRIYISTGRPPQFITNLGQIEDVIDGWVTTNGANCYICRAGKKEIVHTASIPAADTEHILSYCHDRNVPVIIVGRKIIGVNDYAPEVSALFCEGLGVTGIDFQRYTYADMHEDEIMQLTPFLTPEQEQELMPLVSSCNSGRWCDAFTDITAKGADKGIGLTAMAKHEGINLSETMAFGDGGNDNSILRTAGIGIAMGNANEKTKSIADFITTCVDDDGIANALRRFCVI